MAYKTILSGYVNDSKNGPGQYLAITNNSDEVITLKPGDKLFLNKTPQDILDRNPNVPQFSKSVKIEEEASTEKVEEAEDVSDDVPF